MRRSSRLFKNKPAFLLFQIGRDAGVMFTTFTLGYVVVRPYP